ncbi:DEAD DEAH box helicase [Kickxella alabastrina]|nr:DEAD DEAH box helicase [Kickxella alabastrina]
MYISYALRLRAQSRTISKALQQQPRRHQTTHTLRPYQNECIDQCLSKLSAGIRRQAVSLPVGSGKTVIFSSLLQRIPNPTPQATKTLVLAHREELLVQAAQQIHRAAPHLVVEIDQGARVANPAADVIIASVPTLGRRGSERLQRHDPRRFKCVIIDEAHHAAAESYARIVEYFDCTGDLFVWGCSATLYRADGLRLTGVFDEITFQRHFVQMIKDRWLASLRLVTVRTGGRLEGIRSYAGDFAPGALSSAVNTEERNVAVVKAHQTLAAGRRSTLVFAVDVRHAKDLALAFVHFGVPAAAVLGTTPVAERERLLAEFRAGTLGVLVNCGILTEGTDIPNIDCIMMARPTKSAVLFQQMIGRGMRLFPGKADCLVVDFVDSFKRDLTQVTVPTLLGLDPALVLKETDILDADALDKQNRDFVFHGLEPEAMSEDERELSGIMENQRVFEQNEVHATDAGEPLAFGGELPDSLEAIGFRAKEQLDPLGFFTLQGQIPDTAQMDRCQQLDALSCGSRNLRRLSSFSWVCISYDRYLLSQSSNLFFLTRDPKTSLWQGTKRKRLVMAGVESRKFIYSVEKPLGLMSPTLDHAVHGVDSMVRATVQRYQLDTLKWTAAWRALPPTEAQIGALARLGLRVPKGEYNNALPRSVVGKVVQRKSFEPRESGARAGDAKPASSSSFSSSRAGNTKPASSPLRAGGFTRGSAMNLILRLTHGGGKVSRHAEMLEERVKAAREKADNETAKRALWLHMPDTD